MKPLAVEKQPIHFLKMIKTLSNVTLLQLTEYTKVVLAKLVMSYTIKSCFCIYVSFFENYDLFFYI